MRLLPSQQAAAAAAVTLPQEGETITVLDYDGTGFQQVARDSGQLFCRSCASDDGGDWCELSEEFTLGMLRDLAARGYGLRRDPSPT